MVRLSPFLHRTWCWVCTILLKERRPLTTEKVRGEGMKFYNSSEVVIAYNEKIVDMHAWIKVKVPVRENGEIVNKMIETTVGRVIFNQHVPIEVGYINALLDQKESS